MYLVNNKLNFDISWLKLFNSIMLVKLTTYWVEIVASYRNIEMIKINSNLSASIMILTVCVYVKISLYMYVK